MADAAELMAGGTSLSEDLGAAFGVALEREHGTIGFDDILAIGIDRTGKEIGSTRPNAFGIMLQKSLPAGRVNFKRQDLLLLDGVEHASYRRRPAQKNIKHLGTQGRGVTFPAAQEYFRHFIVR